MKLRKYYLIFALIILIVQVLSTTLAIFWEDMPSSFSTVMAIIIPSITIAQLFVSDHKRGTSNEEAKTLTSFSFILFWFLSVLYAFLAIIGIFLWEFGLTDTLFLLQHPTLVSQLILGEHIDINLLLKIFCIVFIVLSLIMYAAFSYFFGPYTRKLAKRFQKENQ